MFEVFDMNPYMKECAIADKEYEIGMMEATYMEMLLDNKLSLNKARAELKVMTESTKDYAVGDLVFLYKEAANETASQSEGIFTKIKNTLVSWFVKSWNAIQKIFTKRNTEAYETLMKSNKKYRIGWNPFGFLKHAEDAVSVAESLPDTITDDIDVDGYGKKILAGLGIGAGGIIGAVAITKAIKNHKEIEKPTEISGKQGWEIVQKLNDCFGRLNKKIDKLKEAIKPKNQPAPEQKQTQQQTQQPAQQNGEQPNGGTPTSGNGTPQGGTTQNNPNQNNTAANTKQNEEKKEEGGKKNPFKAISNFFMSLGSKIREKLDELWRIFGLSGNVGDVHEVSKKVNEEDETDEADEGKEDDKAGKQANGADGDGASGQQPKQQNAEQADSDKTKSGDKADGKEETPKEKEEKKSYSLFDAFNEETPEETSPATSDDKKSEEKNNSSGKSEENSGKSEETPDENSKKEEKSKEEDKEEEEAPSQQRPTEETKKPKRSEKWSDDTTMEIQLLNDYMNKYQKGYGSDTGLAKKAKNTKGLHPAAKEFERLLEKKDSTDEELDKAYKRFSDLCKTAGIRVLVNKDRTRWHFKESADELEVVEFTQDDLDLLRSL